ncbi:MAG: PIN domain-containing protein [Pseudonocardia sp.]|nr:PIN domain-containing protein [Pseudonocardia sp.]
MTALLDGNVLIALVLDEHVHHDPALTWFDGVARFATCPITQGTLVRTLLRLEDRATDAVATIESLTSDDRHEFWPDDLAYTAVRMAGVTGHRQVTDAYLAGLARARGDRLATFDKGLAALHPDVADLVPTS